MMGLKTVDFVSVQNIILEELKTGMFLNVKVGDTLNTMTIAWGNSGRIWEKDSFIVAVRHSRYTFELMEKAAYFTVSMPYHNDLKKELAYCGTVSGRKENKFEKCHLTPEYIDDFPTPIIKECNLHVLCKIAYKQSMDPSLILLDDVKSKYKSNDYHTMYYGEVVGVYINE